jgi:hypothetical protein
MRAIYWSFLARKVSRDLSRDIDAEKKGNPESRGGENRTSITRRNYETVRQQPHTQSPVVVVVIVVAGIRDER